MNVSFFLDERGQSLIELDALLTSLDNKLQPYNFQTHAGVCVCDGWLCLEGVRVCVVDGCVWRV